MGLPVSLRHDLRVRRGRFDLLSIAPYRVDRLLGSGIVESAIRRIVNLRLKGAGIFWKLANLNGMLHLRCHLLAGGWVALEKAVILSLAPSPGSPSI